MSVTVPAGVTRPAAAGAWGARRQGLIMDEYTRKNAYMLQILREATEQWGGGTADLGTERNTLVEQLVTVSWLAHIELARGLREHELVQLGRDARAAGCRSSKPRVVLRKLIELAQARHGWVPTPAVLKVAGMRVPR